MYQDENEDSYMVEACNCECQPQYVPTNREQHYGSQPKQLYAKRPFKSKNTIENIADIKMNFKARERAQPS